MDFKGNGVTTSVNPAELSDAQLIAATQEFAVEAQERGLEVPAFAGAVAVETEASVESTPEVVTPVTKESLAEQLPFSYKGYREVVNALNDGRRKNKQIEAVEPVVVAEELKAWLTDEKLAQVAAIQEADPNVRFTLVATPNVLADSKDVIKAAKAFGEQQPYNTYVWDEIYGKYSDVQLSGADPRNGKAVNFSLIPSTFNPELEGTVEQQRAKLTELQADSPDLIVPSVLDSVTYWSTLRAQGEKLADGTTFDRTYIRHFDLPEQRFDGWLDVPGSYVYVDGGPRLSDSVADLSDGARVAVG